MTIRPGRRLVWTGCGLVGIGLLCFLWSFAVWLLPPALVIILLGVMADYRELRRAAPAIRITRDLPAIVGRGASFSVSLQVSNKLPGPLKAEVRDILPGRSYPRFWSVNLMLLPGKAELTRYEVRIGQRGRHKFGPVWVRLQGPLELLEKQHSYNCCGDVKVLPESTVASESIHKQAIDEILLMNKLPRRHLRGEGTEFESISDFRLGDDPRRIDWRASARRKRLMMRRYQLEQHRDMVMLLDSGRLMGSVTEKGTKLDRAVDSALMLSRVALDKGDRCGLGVFDEEVVSFVPPQSGVGSYPLLMDAVYDVDSRLRESNFTSMFAFLQMRQRKRSLVIVLSDVVDADTSERFRASLVALTHRHIVVFTALRTPLLSNLLRKPSTSALDVSRKTVAIRVLREREKALQSLRKMGVIVLDVEPNNLTVPLLNKYLELREHNAV